MQTEFKKWQAWQAAEERAAVAWASQNVSAQARFAAVGEARAAKQQWADASFGISDGRRAA